MYLIRELCDTSLKQIAQLFSLGSYGGVGGACSVIERQTEGDRKLRQQDRADQGNGQLNFYSTKELTPFHFLWPMHHLILQRLY